MLIVVVLLFILCWGPSIITDMLIGLEKQTITQEFYVFKWVSFLLPFVQYCINPLIYCFMLRNIRNSMTRVICVPFRPCARKCCVTSTSQHLKISFSREKTASLQLLSSFVHNVTTVHTVFEISAI